MPLLVWRFDEPMLAISTAVLGGGIGIKHWVINATVPMSYARDDPDQHLTDLAAGLGLVGPGVGLMTGVDVADLVTATEDDLRVWATVGLGAPIQAADSTQPVESDRIESDRIAVGTVNIVAWLPRQLSNGALVNAVTTITEAKTQAIRDLGLAATGTATDAVCVLSPTDGPIAAYAGPRSKFGQPLARVAYQAVRTGGAVNLAGAQSWSDRQTDTATAD